jgi:hypothetical protein
MEVRSKSSARIIAYEFFDRKLPFQVPGLMFQVCEPKLGTNLKT